MPEYRVVIPFYGHPYTEYNVIYIPLDYIERHFAQYGINKEAVFQHILEHEKLHITNNDAKYPDSTIETTRQFKRYKRYLRRIEKAALPRQRFDDDEEYILLNKICMADLEERIKGDWEKFSRHGKLILHDFRTNSFFQHIKLDNI